MKDREPSPNFSEVPEAPNFFRKSLGVGGAHWALVSVLGGVSLALLSCTMDQPIKPSDQSPAPQTSSTPSVYERQEQSSLQNKDPKADQIKKEDDRLTLDKLLVQKPNLLSEFGQQVGGTDKDFAQTFDMFVNNGATFRSRVLYVQTVGLGEGDANVTQSYDFWKNVLGFETSADGKIKKVEELGVGDIVGVDDFSKPPGIFFRETADAPLDPTADFTYNGDQLRILRDPQIVPDHDRKVAKKMFRTEQVRLDPVWKVFSWIVGGWIDGEYLVLVKRSDTAS